MYIYLRDHRLCSSPHIYWPLTTSAVGRVSVLQKVPITQLYVTTSLQTKRRISIQEVTGSKLNRHLAACLRITITITITISIFRWGPGWSIQSCRWGANILQNSRPNKGDIKQFPHRGPTNIRNPLKNCVERELCTIFLKSHSLFWVDEWSKLVQANGPLIWKHDLMVSNVRRDSKYHK